MIREYLERTIYPLVQATEYAFNGVLGAGREVALVTTSGLEIHASVLSEVLCRKQGGDEKKEKKKRPGHSGRHGKWKNHK